MSAQPGLPLRGGSGTFDPSIERVRDPEWLPHYYDAEANALSFARLPREARQRLVFLDPRFVRGELSAMIAVSDLAVSYLADAAQPLHFIFHVRFCCSTLLTRAFDLPGVAMGLKEPAILAFFKPDTPLASLELALDLLSRPLAGERQIAKPSNSCNDLLGPILDVRPSSRAVLLHADLPSFVRAIARRRGEGRKFAQVLAERFLPATALSAPLLPDGDLRHAAVLWCAQMHLFRAALSRFGARRVRTLTTDALLAAPAEAIFNTAQFFEVDVSKAHAEAIAYGPVFRLHAKEYGVAFDAAAYHAQHAAAQKLHAAEIDAVLAWCEDWAGTAEFALGDTLLAERVS